MKNDQLAVRHVKPDRAAGSPVFDQNFDDGDVADAANSLNLADFAAQRRRHRGAGVRKST